MSHFLSHYLSQETWSDRPNDQTLACRLYRLRGHGLQGIDLHKAGDLGEEPLEQAEVASGNANDCREGLLVCDAVLWERHAEGEPLVLEELTDFRGTQRTKRMHEAHARIELRVPCPTFFDARHPNQDQPNAPCVEDRTDRLQGNHF